MKCTRIIFYIIYFNRLYDLSIRSDPLYYTILYEMTQYTETSASYDDMVEKWDTGHTIIFSARSGLFSTAIKCFTQSKFTHVGMVVKTDYFDDNVDKNFVDPNSLYLWHSIDKPYKYIRNVIGNNLKNGPQLSPLKMALFCYEGTLWSRELKKGPNGGDPIELDTDRLIGAMEDISPLPYEKDVRQLVLSAMDGMSCFDNPQIGANEIDSSYFCSELIVKMLVDMKVAHSSVNPSEYTPSDFYDSNDTISNSMIRPYFYGRNVWKVQQPKTVNIDSIFVPGFKMTLSNEFSIPDLFMDRWGA